MSKKSIWEPIRGKELEDWLAKNSPERINQEAVNELHEWCSKVIRRTVDKDNHKLFNEVEQAICDMLGAKNE